MKFMLTDNREDYEVCLSQALLENLAAVYAVVLLQNSLSAKSATA